MTIDPTKTKSFTLATQKYEDRIVIFIDIIGFKEFVNTQEVSNITAFFAEFEKQVSGGEIMQHGAAYTQKAAFMFFSDTIVISFSPELSVGRDGKYNSLLSTIQHYICEVQLHALKFNLLTRGSVSYGAIYHNSHTWFGPAILEAYKYEQEIAIYPRIVITPSLEKLIKEEINRDQKQVSPALSIGEDGVYFFDYLGWIDVHSFDEDYAVAHTQVREIIQNNLVGNLPDKALVKWRWLANYFNVFTQEHLISNHGDKVGFVSL